MGHRKRPDTPAAARRGTLPPLSPWYTAAIASTIFSPLYNAPSVPSTSLGPSTAGIAILKRAARLCRHDCRAQVLACARGAAELSRRLKLVKRVCGASPQLPGLPTSHSRTAAAPQRRSLRRGCSALPQHQLLVRRQGVHEYDLLACCPQRGPLCGGGWGGGGTGRGGVCGGANAGVSLPPASRRQEPLTVFICHTASRVRRRRLMCNAKPQMKWPARIAWRVVREHKHSVLDASPARATGALGAP